MRSIFVKKKPEWLPDGFKKEVNRYFRDNVYGVNHCKIVCYSEVVHRVIVQLHRPGRLGYWWIYYVYDFDKHSGTKIVDACYPVEIEYSNYDPWCGDPEEHNNDYGSNFVSFKTYECMYTDDLDDDDYVEDNLPECFFLDERFNNAPNLNNSDVFEKDSIIGAMLFHDLLYYEYEGRYVLIDGEHNIIGEFPARLSLKYNEQIDTKCHQFIIQEGNTYSVYDTNSKRIVFDNLTNLCAGYKTVDFLDNNGDYYIYDKNNEEFILSVKHDPFLDRLREHRVLSYIGSGGYDTQVHVYRGKNKEFYLVQGNVVLNKDCPFEKVVLEDESYSAKYRCETEKDMDYYDIWCRKFRYNKFGLNK